MIRVNTFGRQLSHSPQLDIKMVLKNGVLILVEMISKRPKSLVGQQCQEISLPLPYRIREI